MFRKLGPEPAMAGGPIWDHVYSLGEFIWWLSPWVASLLPKSPLLSQKIIITSIHMWCFSHLLFVNASISKVLINLLLRFSQLGKATCDIFLSFDDTSINNATLDSWFILCLWYFHHLFRGMPLCMHTNSHLVNKVRKTADWISDDSKIANHITNHFVLTSP